MIVRCQGRGVVHVTGADATSFLQSLLSQDLDAVADGGAVHALLLTPQGKLDVDLRARRVSASEWWLDTWEGLGEPARAALRRFKVRVDVELTDESDSSGVVAVRGDDAALLDRVAVPDDVGVVPVAWAGAPGVDLVGPADAVDRVAEGLVGAGGSVGSSADLEALRIAAGIPRQGLDTDERTIPQEAFLERDAVSFTKGCFLGQELVCRIDTRGHVNRHLRGLRLAEEAGRGAALAVDGTDVGTVTSAAVHPTLGPIALAMVRREVEPGATVTVGDPGGAATLVELPFPS
jgi:tRNA-modifying protein YgfZ